MKRTAKPIGPVIIARSLGQFCFTQSITFFTAPITASKAALAFSPIFCIIARKVSLLLYKTMKRATRATTAVIIKPIGFNLKTILRTFCTATNAFVTPVAIIVMAFRILSCIINNLICAVAILSWIFLSFRAPIKRPIALKFASTARL